MSSERRSLRVSAEPGRAPILDLAERLLDAYLDPEAREMQHIGSYELPLEGEVERAIEITRALLFPGYAGPDVARTDRGGLQEIVAARLGELRSVLQHQVYRALHHRRQQ